MGDGDEHGWCAVKELSLVDIATVGNGLAVHTGYVMEAVAVLVAALHCLSHIFLHALIAVRLEEVSQHVRGPLWDQVVALHLYPKLSTLAALQVLRRNLKHLQPFGYG